MARPRQKHPSSITWGWKQEKLRPSPGEVFSLDIPVYRTSGLLVIRPRPGRKFYGTSDFPHRSLIVVYAYEMADARVFRTASGLVRARAFLRRAEVRISP